MSLDHSCDCCCSAFRLLCLSLSFVAICSVITCRLFSFSIKLASHAGALRTGNVLSTTFLMLLNGFTNSFTVVVQHEATRRYEHPGELCDWSVSGGHNKSSSCNDLYSVILFLMVLCLLWLIRLYNHPLMDMSTAQQSTQLHYITSESIIGCENRCHIFHV